KMKASRLAASIALLAFVLTVPQATTAQDKRAAQPTPASTTAAAPAYKPPLRGAPGGRVGGGTRGTGRETSFVLSVLAPDHTGLTASEQPSLYWFISRPTAFPVEISIVDPSATEPLLEAQLPPPIEPGVHRIRLADRCGASRAARRAPDAGGVAGGPRVGARRPPGRPGSERPRPGGRRPTS